jgi:hypothetical protein
MIENYPKSCCWSKVGTQGLFGQGIAEYKYDIGGPFVFERVTVTWGGSSGTHLYEFFDPNTGELISSFTNYVSQPQCAFADGYDLAELMLPTGNINGVIQADCESVNINWTQSNTGGVNGTGRGRFTMSTFQGNCAEACGDGIGLMLYGGSGAGEGDMVMGAATERSTRVRGFSPGCGSCGTLAVASPADIAAVTRSRTK